MFSFIKMYLFKYEWFKQYIPNIHNNTCERKHNNDNNAKNV